MSETALPGVLILEPKVFTDERGFFFESFNERDFAAATGTAVRFVQDNHSCSGKSVLRGLHYQIVHPQAKLVRVTTGEVFDVAVDVRARSPTFGQWIGVTLSEENKRLLWIPEGFAHGFLVTSDRADFLYKTTDFYYPEHERTVRWDDPAIGIRWPLDGSPRLAKKDAAAGPLRDAEVLR